MNRHYAAIMGILAGTSALTSAHGAVITPALVSGADAMDPAGFESVNVQVGTQMSTLESDASFAAIQDFTGFVKTGSTAVNVVDLSGRPDVRFSLTGDLGTTAGAATETATLLSSAGAAISLFAANNTGQQVLTVEFGQYNAGNDTFATGETVASVGFILNNHRSGLNYVVSFFNAAGVQVGSTLSTSGANEGTGTYHDVSVGYRGDGQLATGVAKVVIERNPNVSETARGTTTQGLDDFGFAVIPEPSVVALSVLALPFLRRRRQA